MLSDTSVRGLASLADGCLIRLIHLVGSRESRVGHGTLDRERTGPSPS